MDYSLQLPQPIDSPPSTQPTDSPPSTQTIDSLPIKPIQTPQSFQPDNLSTSIYRTKIASYVVGALALAMLIVSVFLLVFIRNRSSNTIHTSVTVTPSPGPIVIPKMVQLQPFSSSNSVFTASDLSKLVSVSTGIITPSVSCNIVINGSCVQPTPVYEPGDVPFNTTMATPIQNPAQGYGWCAITPDADQWFTSSQNGLAVFGQYIVDSSVTTGTAFKFYQDPYSGGGNQMLFTCTTASSGANANVDASAVGSVGFRSMAMSPDGVRLYVAYRQPFMGQPNGPNESIFPFLQLIGRVGVFTRPADATTSIQNPSASSNSWTYSCDLALSNPFGSQISGLSTVCDPTTLLIRQSDDYGTIIRTSYNYTSGQRMIAIRSNFGYLMASGAIVSVYEELSSGSHQLVGTLQLQSSYVPLINAATLGAQKRSFGSSFAIFNDVCICAVRVRTGGCCTATELVNQLIVFVRNMTTLIWEFKQLVTTPDATKDFGAGVETNGTLLIVSAPTFGTFSTATPRTAGTTGIGGAVYLYHRSGTTFSLVQTVQDPTTGAYGAFGSYIAVDPQFLVVAITYNQDNSPDKPAVAFTSSSKTSGVLFLAIDLINSAFGPVDKAQTIQQSYGGTDLYDQTFGANMALAFKNHKQSTLVALVNSPTNQRVTVYTMNVGT